MATKWAPNVRGIANKKRAEQTHFFKAMIPKNLIEYWHKGNNEGHTHLKLCGAGGGGYLLGLSTLKEKQVSLLYPDFKMIALPFS